MTALALTAQKMIPFRMADYAFLVRARFLAMNRRGILSVALLAAAAAAGAAYLVALFVLFDLGMALQAASRQMAGIQQDILKSEIILAADDANFTAAHREITDTMEQISSVSYLPRPAGAALAPAPDFAQ